MPTVNEIGDFPADILWYFRRASLLTMATMWAVIGVGLTGLIGRLYRAGRRPRPSAASWRPACDRGRPSTPRRRTSRQRPPNAWPPWRPRPGRWGGWATSPSGSRLPRARCPPRAARQRAAGDLRRRPRRRRARRLGVPARDHRRDGPHLRRRARRRLRPRRERTASPCACSTSGSTTTSTACPTTYGATRCGAPPGRSTSRTRSPPSETRRALEVGAVVAREEIAAGAQLLISGDMGIGNTTPAAALVAAGLGLPGHRGRRPRHRHRRRGARPQGAGRSSRRSTGPATAPTTRSTASPRSAAPTWPPAPATCSRPPARACRCCSTG